MARIISDTIEASETKLIDLEKNPNPDISQADRIILGGSIHAGMVQKSIKDFYTRNRNTLLQKELGLYLCCMMKEEEVSQFENAFPEDLRKHARASLLPGGEFNFSKMNFFEKTIVKKVSGVKENISMIDEMKIFEFCQSFS